MIKPVNVDKRLKFKKTIRKIIGAGLFITLMPNVIGGYVFKDETSNKILDLQSSVIYAHNDIIGKAFIGTSNIGLTRDVNGDMNTVTIGTRTWTITRDINGNLSSLTDGVIIKTINRDGNGVFTGMTVTGGV